jgi:hypothetical protein
MAYTRIRKYLIPIYLTNGIFISPYEANRDKDVVKFIKKVLWQEGVDQKYIVEPYDIFKVKTNSLVVSLTRAGRENMRVYINRVSYVNPEEGGMAMHHVKIIAIPGYVWFPKHAKGLPDDTLPQVKVTVNGYEMIADLAINRDRDWMGLGAVHVKPYLDKGEGLLNVFESEDERHPFWTKELRTSLDLIWLDSQGIVVHIEQNVKPCVSRIPFRESSNCPEYDPDVKASFLFEIPAGFVQQHEIKLGTRIEFKPIL